MASARDEKFIKALGDNARRLRKAKGKTQEWVEYNSVLDLRQVGRIERGEANSTVSVIKAFADAIGVHVREMFDFEIEEETEKD
jgi:transcriptional regulator with XRE-family HTH domain